MEPFDFMDASRTAVLTDPKGAAFRVSKARRAQGRAGGERPGLTELQRPQHPRRRRGEVVLRIGVRWQTLALDGGLQMWALPGYGDHLERDNPGLRTQLAEAGAPEQFEDVVATINPIPDDQPDTPAQSS